ncbi:MAG: hypothetical protein JW871_08460 [Endomicrobiales bacterium]|nr:hypothetical protein [Endomicrobiales bacterium]
MKEDIKLLIQLQNKDIELDKLRYRAEAIPKEIEQSSTVLNQYKEEIESSRNELKKLQVSRKEKEVDLESKENDIKKHNLDLNSIKTNEAYKAKLNEIEGSKKQKQALEDEILVFMEQIEQKSLEVKQKEKEFKEQEAGVSGKINILKKELEQVNQKVSELEPARSEFVKKVPGKLFSHYEHIRSGRQGVAVVPIDGENCGGCNITLRPQIINDVYKAQDLVFCDSCSRILYKPSLLEEENKSDIPSEENKTDTKSEANEESVQSN